LQQNLRVKVDPKSVLTVRPYFTSCQFSQTRGYSLRHRQPTVTPWVEMYPWHIYWTSRWKMSLVVRR